MKKLINKLFKKLGYVPKEEYDELKDYKTCANWHDMTVADIHTHSTKYTYEDLFSYILVSCVTKDTSDHSVGYPIKRFDYTDQESKEYARICAEELCEMLNEELLPAKEVKSINEMTIDEVLHLQKTYKKEFIQTIENFLKERPFIKHIHFLPKTIIKHSLDKDFSKNYELWIKLDCDFNNF